MMKITEALVAEHTVFSTIFTQIERALPELTTLAAVKAFARLVEALLEEHGRTEEDLAYAALDHALENKGQLDRLYEDHREINAHLKRVHAARTVAQARQLLKTAILAAREHFHQEERLAFPLIEQTIEGETLAQLGDAWKERRLGGSSLAHEQT
jgi:hemerythrin-like domain-containing protein